MATFSELYESFDHGDSNAKGSQFEHVCKWFLENDSRFAPLLEKVWHWKDWPGRDMDSDFGIDLMAKRKDGQL